MQKPRLASTGRLAVTATFLSILLINGAAVWPQSAPIKIVLTGQSMIRSDIRFYMPGEVSTIAPLLKGDAGVYLAGKHRFPKSEKQGPRTLLIDQRTGSFWDGLEGRPLSGASKGKRLQEVAAMTGFWFAQYTFNPTTRVLRP